jgi:hypothetical protein
LFGVDDLWRWRLDGEFSVFHALCKNRRRDAGAT